MIDFFSYAHVLPIQQQIAIVDAGNNSPVQIEEVDSSKKQVIVISNNRLDYNFIPVDHNVPLKKANGTDDKICDAIVFTASTICFIEIKNYRKGQWIKKASKQVLNTIKHYIINHSYSKMRKVAYLCNCKKRDFIIQETHKELQDIFLTKHKTRLYISAQIDELK